MQLRPENLPSHLEQQLLPVYFVTGDETLLVQESCDRIRATARAAGCSERKVIEPAGGKLDWNALAHGAAEMSLFSARKLIELRIPTGKPGVLCEGDKGQRYRLLF